MSEQSMEAPSDYSVETSHEVSVDELEQQIEEEGSFVIELSQSLMEAIRYLTKHSVIEFDDKAAFYNDISDNINEVNKYLYVLNCKVYFDREEGIAFLKTREDLDKPKRLTLWNSVILFFCRQQFDEGRKQGLSKIYTSVEKMRSDLELVWGTANSQTENDNRIKASLEKAVSYKILSKKGDQWEITGAIKQAIPISKIDEYREVFERAKKLNEVKDKDDQIGLLDIEEDQ